MVGGLCWGLLHFVGYGREAVDVALYVGCLALPLLDVLLHVGKLGAMKSMMAVVEVVFLALRQNTAGSM